MPKVGVFISWSGNSYGVARALYEWLPTALHSINPWMSNLDIRKGTRFLEEIDRALAACKAGLICLTPENNQSVWVAFEAGAMASRVGSSKLVIPLVSRMRPSDVRGPLEMFQASQLTADDMLALIKSLNELNIEEDKIPENRLLATFHGVWPDFARQLPALEKEQTAGGEEIPARKSDSQLLEEILGVSKSIRILVEDRLRETGAPPEESPPSGTALLDEPGMASGAGLAGREGFPAVAQHLTSASEIWLAGVSLLTVLSQYLPVFREYVERDRLSLRFLVLDPHDDLLISTAVRSLYGITTPEELRRDIASVVETVSQLRTAAANSARVQLRYMTNLPGTSIIMADPMAGNGTAIAEFYPYRASSSDRPHIFLNEIDHAERKWFLFYREQFLAMWRDARESPEVDDAG
jgi:hypothetical protein